jgi:inorganic pyrophosphatase
MLAFHLTAEKALLFFEICGELKADTEEKKVAILEAMAELGQIQNIVQTPKTKEEYIQHLSKHFKVLKIGDTSNG